MGALEAVFFVVLASISTLALSLQVRELCRLCREEKKILKKREELRGDLKAQLENLEYLREKCPDWATETRDYLEQSIASIRKVLA